MAERVLVNPVTVQTAGRLTERSEGCLSLPNYCGSVPRRNKIVARSWNVEGREFFFTAEGYEAAVVQHEIDHMNGVLYWDRMKPNSQPRPRKT